LEKPLFRSPEQQHFFNILAKHLESPIAPLLLEGGVGLGKTRAYLAAIAKTKHTVAIVLPTHQLMDQLLASKDLAAVGLDIVAFRPSRMFEVRADYLAQRQLARTARVMLCTAASVIIDQRLQGEYNGATGRDVLVFDEADQLPDMTALQSDFVIDASLLQGQPLQLALERISSTKSHTVEAEQKAAARVMLEILAEPVGYAAVGIDADGNARLHHRLPGRLLKKVSNRASTVFISATLSHAGKFDNFEHAIGLDTISPLSTAIEPAQHGTLDFAIHAHEAETDEWFAAVVNGIRTALRPTLVVTPSHELSQRLQADLGEQDGLLIRAGAWAGFDTPTRWRTVVIPRVPFGAPVVVDGEVVTSYLDAKVTAVRRMRQAIGRGLRTPDAVCTVLIYDARAVKLGTFVPYRFESQWALRKVFEEGAREELVLSKAERDPGLRKAALKHYGTQCQHEGCTVNQSHLLDVHHLTPIAEGVRRTTLKDVTVLCANHHRQAHFEIRNAPA
jgi:Rad3-related DNA helicase